MIAWFLIVGIIVVVGGVLVAILLALDEPSPPVC